MVDYGAPGILGPIAPGLNVDAALGYTRIASQLFVRGRRNDLVLIGSVRVHSPVQRNS